MNKTQVQDDIVLTGQEFERMLTTNIYNRLFELIKNASLSCVKDTIKKLEHTARFISDSEREGEFAKTSWIIREGKPISYDENWCSTTKEEFQILEALGLSKPAEDDFCELESANGSKKMQ